MGYFGVIAVPYDTQDTDPKHQQKDQIFLKMFE